MGVITPGKDAFHTDELFLPGLPEAVAADPRFEMPLLIITALTYLTDVDRALCPTYVVPESFRSGRRPAAGETSWRGNAPLVVLAAGGWRRLVISRLSVLVSGLIWGWFQSRRMQH